MVRIGTGAIQDRDNNSYANVVIVYVALTAGALAVAIVLLLSSTFLSKNLSHLQWTRKQRRANGNQWNTRRAEFEEGQSGKHNRGVSLGCLSMLGLMMIGAWSAFFWGVAHGKTE